MSERSARIKKLAVMAMLIALSVILVYLIHFPIFPAAAFLEYDPADIPILICAFAYGPVAGIFVAVIASVIQGLTVSAASGIYGILMHIIATATLVLVSSIIYRVRHSRAGAIVGLVCGTVAMGVVMMIANHFITPFFMSTTPESFVAMQQATDKMLLPVILPFNLLKAGVNSVMTFLVYKVVSKYIVHGREMQVSGKKAENESI